MFHRNRKTFEEKNLKKWALRLDKGEVGEPTLQMAARLLRSEQSDLSMPHDVKAALRTRLVETHQLQLNQQPTVWQRAERQLRSWKKRFFTRRYLFGLLAILLLMLAYWQQDRWWGPLLGKMDDWQYSPSATTLRVSAVVEYMTPILWSAGAIPGVLFLTSLGYLFYYQWTKGYRPELLLQRRRLQMAKRGVWISSLASLLLAVAIVSFSTASENRSSIQLLALNGTSRVGQPMFQLSPSANDRAFLSRADLRSAFTPDMSHIGFSVDGAKDINNFRQNIQEGFLPLPTDITAEGLFYDYFFETGAEDVCQELFCPSYAQAQSRDPLTGQVQQFLSVGLNGGIKTNEFQRKPLNLVIVLDISSSMSESFNRYYYDQPRQSISPLRWGTDGASTESKLQAATKAVSALLDHLSAQDRLGIVLFDDTSHLAKPLNLVGNTDMGSIKLHLRSLQPQGGTNIEAGYRLGSDLLRQYSEDYSTENRIIFLTDAQPNQGDISSAGLASHTKANADRNIHTTFIGIGVDFNTQLIEEISKIRGGNYYAIHESGEFIRHMDSGFDYMVTPLVFDLQLTMQSADWEIEQIYGAPLADRATGEILRINTLFPTESRDGEVKGGLILLQLRRKSTSSDAPGNATLAVTYQDGAGKLHQNQTQVSFSQPTETDRFDNPGIRKGILLARYASLLRNWVSQERGTSGTQPISSTHTVISGEQADTTAVQKQSDGWERQSQTLRISPIYHTYFEQFNVYFEAETDALGDETLQQEEAILEKLITLYN